MFRSMLLIGLRQFSRNTSVSLISLIGLIVGVTVGILTFFWIAYEVRYDRYHPDNDRVFTILSNNELDGEIDTSDEVPVQLIEFLKTEVPEVQLVTRVDGTRAQISYKEKVVNRYGAYADVDYFDVFAVPVISGNRKTLLSNPASIALSERMAVLLFGSTDVIGKTVSVDSKMDLIVTGVFKELPFNSSMNYVHYVMPFNVQQRDPAEWRPVFVKLNGAGAKLAVEKKVNAKLNALFPDDNISSLLFCMTDWRLHWSFENGKVSGGRVTYVAVFAITALFILLMTCVNYTNIATAAAVKRAREIGVRKISGATRGNLIRQFIFESVVSAFIATGISVFAAYLLLPAFNQLMGVSIVFSFTDPLLVAGLISISLFTGLAAGSYPAFLLSSLKPAEVFKANPLSALTGATFRKSLVVFQFALSIILIFSAFVLSQQIDFMLKKDLGFDKNNVLIIDSYPNGSIASFKSELITSSAIVSVGVSDSSPIEINGGAEVQVGGSQPLVFNGASCDDGYLSAIGLKFVRGRGFSTTDLADSNNFIITQKGADLLGFEDPIGQRLKFPMYHNQEGKIIGVIKDFHNDDIHLAANAVIFSNQKQRPGRIFVRYKQGMLNEALNHIKAVFAKFQPGEPINYGFLDQDFENQFNQERQFKKFSISFTVVAVGIACMGLLGLTIFNAQRRTKEIAIRKVLGATIGQIMNLLYRDFGKPLGAAFLVAFPVSYFVMNQFLESYPFRITISFFVFVIVALIMIGVVIFTVSIKSFQAAVKNPVDSLKE